MVIEVDDFFAVDLRVGRIETVQAFEQARKPAWKLSIDFGPEIAIKKPLTAPSYCLNLARRCRPEPECTDQR